MCRYRLCDLLMSDGQNLHPHSRLVLLFSEHVSDKEACGLVASAQNNNHLPFFRICNYISPSCSLEKAMATHCSTLAWKIPWTEEPGGLQSMGSLRVGHDWATSLSLFTFIHWRRHWQPTPVFLPGECQGWGSLVGCRLWGSHRVRHDWSDLAAAECCSPCLSFYPLNIPSPLAFRETDLRLFPCLLTWVLSEEALSLAVHQANKQALIIPKESYIHSFSKCWVPTIF